MTIGDRHSVANPQRWLCNTCYTTESVWACLSCPNVACGRWVFWEWWTFWRKLHVNLRLFGGNSRNPTSARICPYWRLNLWWGLVLFMSCLTAVVRMSSRPMFGNTKLFLCRFVELRTWPVTTKHSRHARLRFLNWIFSDHRRRRKSRMFAISSRSKFLIVAVDSSLLLQIAMDTHCYFDRRGKPELQQSTFPLVKIA